MLTERLVPLRRQGIVVRENGRYQLTERGLLVRPLLEELYRTGVALLAH